MKRESPSRLLLDAQSLLAAVAQGSTDPSAWALHAIAAASLRDRIHRYRKGGEDSPLTEPKRRGRPPADKRHRPVIDLWQRLWLSVRGGDAYVVSGGRDGNAVRRLLQATPGVDLAEFEARMRAALADPWFQKNGHLALFCSRWSNYDRARGTVVRPSRVMVSFDAETNERVFADGSREAA